MGLDSFLNFLVVWFTSSIEPLLALIVRGGQSVGTSQDLFSLQGTCFRELALSFLGHLHRADAFSVGDCEDQIELQIVSARFTGTKSLHGIGRTSSSDLCLVSGNRK